MTNNCIPSSIVSSTMNIHSCFQVFNFTQMETTNKLTNTTYFTVNTILLTPISPSPTHYNAKLICMIFSIKHFAKVKLSKSKDAFHTVHPFRMTSSGVYHPITKLQSAASRKNETYILSMSAALRVLTRILQELRQGLHTYDTSS